jgi:hypothetical protein
MIRKLARPLPTPIRSVLRRMFQRGLSAKTSQQRPLPAPKSYAPGPLPAPQPALQHLLTIPGLAPVLPMMPEFLERLLQEYRGLDSEADREAASRMVIQQLVFNPLHGSFLSTGYCENAFGGEELYLHAAAATAFGRADIRQAGELFGRAARLRPTRFNLVSEARCRFAYGDLAGARESLRAALERYPSDFETTMELATFHYLAGETTQANRLLEPVKWEFATPEFAEQRRQGQALTEEVAAALREKSLHRKAETDIYNDTFTTSAWWGYWRSFQLYNQFQEGSAWLRYLIEDRIGQLLKSDPSVKTVLDFGVLCAVPNYELAKRFPATEFVGIDRQELVKTLNERSFQLPNLRFLAGDVLEALPQVARKGSPTALFHARTACLCYPEFLRRLYRTCAQLDVQYVVLYETLSMSKSYLRFYDYENMPADAIGIRSIMYAHNYPAYLREAGYQVLVNDRVASGLLLNDRSDLGASNVVIVARKR